MDAPLPDRWHQIEILFTGAVELPVGERAAFLDARAPDPALRAEVERLLGAHDRAGGFLGELDTERAADLVRSVDDMLVRDQSLGPYRLLRRLGQGGMGVVWLAHDPRLDRPVALKVLPAPVGASEAARRRLTQEAQAASALDHPNIATIYDIGETPDGRAFVAMAYYDGESLRERLTRGPLHPGEALRLLIQIAEGLAAAHAAGIVHRDIKPGNVMLTREGLAKIVDFGIAKVAGRSSGGLGETAGTISYMSPEQTRGGQVDARADVWACGVLLHELLAGERPFRGDDEQGVIHAIRSSRSTPLREVRPDVPEAVVRVVDRCLQKDSEARFADAAELLAALRAAAVPAPRPRAWPAVAGVAATLALAMAIAAWQGALWSRGESGPGGQRSDSSPLALDNADPAPVRLAVLPLANLSPAGGEEYFADGLTEELIARLSRLSQVRVIARTSVMPYKGTGKAIAEIGRELAVAAVLEGSVRTFGGEVRVTVQLVDVESQAPLWSETYDAEAADVLRLQRDIAERVVGSLRLRLDPPERQTLRSPDTTSPEAHRLHLQGRHVLHRRTAASLEQSVRYFEEALGHDPSFAAAYAGLAEAWLHLGNYGIAPGPEAQRRARAAAERAIELDPATTEAFAVLGLLRMATLDFIGVEHAFQQALALNPSDATAHHWYGFFLGSQGRAEEGIRSVRRARDLDPLALPVVSTLARLLVHVGETAAARGELESAIDLDPSYPWTWYSLALAYAVDGRLDEAMFGLEQALDRLPGQPRLLSAKAALHARAGMPGPAREILHELAAGADPVARAYELAVVHAALGEMDESFDWLRQVTWSSEHLFSVRTDPLLAPLRGSARYEKFIEQLGL
jgi:TolB-like protein/Tfp pilus assembly protein PilF/predicted Ser/Thr protein kinase